MSNSKQPARDSKAPLRRPRKDAPKVEVALPVATSEAELRALHVAFRDALRHVDQATRAADARFVGDALQLADELAAGVGNNTNREVWTGKYQEARLLANAVLQVSHWTGIGVGKPDLALLHYVRRAMLIGAELQRAGLFVKGTGGRNKDDGAHDNTATFEKALWLLEGPLGRDKDGKTIKRQLKGTVFEDLAKELIRRGEKHGDPKMVGGDLQRKYNRWREALTSQAVSLILNQMTCPTCGAKVHDDLH